ncbi:STAS domain-containing protein [Actinoplanes oblitus]|uniref:STAS domain-containing protein n=1 Tax=Actinoplanes oblitus TaxID=3040509 RepID=UPI0038991337
MRCREIPDRDVRRVASVFHLTNASTVPSRQRPRSRGCRLLDAGSGPCPPTTHFFGRRSLAGGTMDISRPAVALSSPLRIDLSCPSPGVVRVVMIGEIDLATVGMLHAELLTVLFALRPRRIDVELAAVTFLDCSGLTALIVARQVGARTGCRLRIKDPQGIVRRVLKLTGLLGVLTAEPGRAPLAAIGPAGVADVFIG